MDDEVLRVSHVAKAFKNGPERLDILKDVSCRLSRETSLAIQGESGSGKTTLLNLIGGLDKPDGKTNKTRKDHPGPRRTLGSLCRNISTQ